MPSFSVIHHSTIPFGINGDCNSDISLVKDIILDFINRSPHRPSMTPPNVELRNKISEEITSWDSGLPVNTFEAMLEIGCVLTESVFKHLSPSQQCVIAVYTSCLAYVDDVAKGDPNVIRRFVGKFSAHVNQNDATLNRLAALLLEMPEHFDPVSADGIIVSTLELFMGTCMELSNGKKGVGVQRGAKRYPYWLRMRTGFSLVFCFFVFGKDWNLAEEHLILQLLPYVSTLLHLKRE